MALSELDEWWIGKWNIGNVYVQSGDIGLTKDESKFRIECDENGHNWRLKIRKKMNWEPDDLNLIDAGPGVATRFTTDPFDIDPDGLHVATLTGIQAKDQITIDVNPYEGSNGTGRGTGDAGRG